MLPASGPVMYQASFWLAPSMASPPPPPLMEPMLAPTLKTKVSAPAPPTKF